MKRKIPLIPLSIERAEKLSERFLGIGETLSGFFPSLDFELEETGFGMSSRKWMGLAFFTFLFYFLVTFLLIFVFSGLARVDMVKSIFISSVSGLGIGVTGFFFLSFYPKLLLMRKVKDIEKNLPYVLNHLLVQVRSGVPLFNCLIHIARSNYGLLSEEFKNAVNEINTGRSETEALEKLARGTPSLFFRRVMWQMINALKSGADIGSTIKEIVESISVEQRVAIKKYGSQLNPMALMYMLFAVIFPTLGVTFLLVLGSITNMVLNLNMVLIEIIIFITFFQLMFIGLVKSRRPTGLD